MKRFSLWMNTVFTAKLFAGFFAAYSFIYSYYFTPLGKAGFCAGA